MSPQPFFIRRLLAATAVLSVLASCSATKLPTRFEFSSKEQNAIEDLRITAATSPKPDAIVGMWYRNADHRDGLKTHITDRKSLLIRQDGTMIVKTRDGPDGGTNYSYFVDWKYLGGGRWSTGQFTEMWISGNTLVYKPFGVFERVTSDSMGSNP